MVRNLSRSQQRGLVLVSAVILGALFFFHWMQNQEPKTSDRSALLPGRPVIIELSGAVRRPGLYSYDRPPSIGRVLEDGGGPSGEAEAAALRADEVLPGETRLTVSVAASRGLSFERGPFSVRALWILGRPIPVNQATVEELDAVPGIGPGLARRIVERRETQGPFAELEELQQIPGVGEKTLEKLHPYLTAP